MVLAFVALLVTLPAASGAHRASGQPPTMDGHGDMTVAATSPSFTPVTFTATATDPDNPSSELTIVCVYDGAHGVSFQSGGTNSAQLSVGTYSVSCTARDPQGNTSGAVSFNLVVQAYVDTSPPLLFLPSYNVVAPTSAGAMVALNPGATDPPWDPPHVTLTCDHDLGNQLFPIGVTTVTCTGVDQAGNSSSGSFTVTVTGQTTTGATTVTTTTATTTTVVTATTSTTTTPAATTTVTVPTQTRSQPTTTRSVATAPTIHQQAPVVVDAASPIGAVVRFATKVDGPAKAAATCVPASGSLFGLGPRAGTNTITVTCTASDASGVAAKPMSFRVTVRGARDQVQQLQRKVATASGIPKAVKRLLANELVRTDSDIGRGRSTAAQAELASFIKSARTAKRTQWIKPAARIIAVLG